MTGKRVGRVGSGYIFIVFGLTMVMGALAFIVLQEPMDMMLGHAEAQSSTNQSAKGVGYVQQGVDAFPWVLALLGVVQIIAGAARSYRRGGGL